MNKFQNINLGEYTKEELQVLRDSISQELIDKDDSERFRDGFDRYKLITPEECPDTMTRLIHNREAMKHNPDIINTMIEVRNERFDERNHKFAIFMKNFSNHRFR